MSKNNGHTGITPETFEDLKAADEFLDDRLANGDSILSAVLNNPGVLQTIIQGGGADKFQSFIFFRLCNFATQEEAAIHINAYHEAKRYHMSTDYNIDMAAGLSSVQSQAVGNNLVSQVLGVWNMMKYMGQNNNKGKNSNNSGAKQSVLSGD